MSAVPKRLLSQEEYLAQERLAPFKSEYFKGEVFAMAGARYRHNRIKDNLAYELHDRLKRGSCVPLTSDMRVHIPTTTLYTYPDIVVVCGKPVFQDDNDDVLLNPQIIIEVLSESTEKYDRGAKFRQYQQIDSLKEYILVAQNEARIECFVRQPANQWLLSNYTGIDAALTVSSVNVTIPLTAIYQGVEMGVPEAE